MKAVYISKFSMRHKSGKAQDLAVPQQAQENSTTRKFGSERFSNEIGHSPNRKVFNSFALPMSKPKNSNQVIMSTPTKNGKSGSSCSRLTGDTISSSLKKKQLRSGSIQKEENQGVSFAAGTFRSNSAVSVSNGSSVGKCIGNGISGKEVQVSSISLGPTAPHRGISYVRNKENNTESFSADAKAAV